MASEGFMGAEVIPFGITTQSLSEYVPTNGISHHAYMDIARRNIAHLMELRQVSTNQVGVESGVDQPWLHKYLKGTIRKANPEKIALLERYFGLSPGSILYRDLTQPDSLPPSQPTQLERQIMAAAVKLLQEMEEYSPVTPDPSTYADRLAIAAKVVRQDGVEGILDESTLDVALRHYAAELRKVG